MSATAIREQILSDGDSKPITLPLLRQNIPRELIELNRWVGWRFDWVADREKWNKTPINARTGRNAKSDTESTWSAFSLACERYTAKAFDGIGITLGNVGSGRKLVGIDIDDCRNPETGVVCETALAIIALIGSYSEVSPTGTGVKIFCWGQLPAGRRVSECGQFECYEDGRYFTVTGHIVDHVPRELRDATIELEQFHQSLVDPPRIANCERATHGLSDRELAVDALRGLGATRADNRYDWIRVGMSLKSVDESLLSEWISWSSKSEKFKGARDCEKTWASFKRSGIGIGSLIHLAKSDGWRIPSRHNSTIGDDRGDTDKTLRLLANGRDDVSGMRIEMLLTVPAVVYRVYANVLKSKTKHGRIELSHTQVTRGRAVFDAFVAVGHKYSSHFPKDWQKDGGICDTLWQSMKTVEAEPEERRDIVVAAAILEWFERAKIAGDGQQPDPRGYPTRMSDGSIWFKISAMHEDIGHTLAKITHGEIVGTAKDIGCEDRTYGKERSRKRSKVATLKALSALRTIAGVG